MTEEDPEQDEMPKTQRFRIEHLLKSEYMLAKASRSRRNSHSKLPIAIKQNKNISRNKAPNQ